MKRNFGSAAHFGSQGARHSSSFASGRTHGNPSFGSFGSRTSLGSTVIANQAFNGRHYGSAGFRGTQFAGHHHGGHKFNPRWSGGWNKWNNRSYFFGSGTPFGSYYRGYYGSRGYGWSRPWLSIGFYPYFNYGWGLSSYGYGGYGGYGFGYPCFGYASYLNAYPYYAASYPLYTTGYPAYTTGGYSYAASYPAGYTSYYGNTAGTAYVNAATTPYAAADPAVYDAPALAASEPVDQVASAGPLSVNDLTAADFAGQGELDFRAGQYEIAARNFRHALVDDPSNAGVLMMLGQALFAMGQYDEAAGATAIAMQQLPQDKWGAVVENRQQLYGSPADYTTQLQALEKARDAEPESPALHFLLGFQYAYSGNPTAAVGELDRAMQLEPDDPMAKALRDRLTGKPSATGQSPTAPVDPATGRLRP